MASMAADDDADLVGLSDDQESDGDHLGYVHDGEGAATSLNYAVLSEADLQRRQEDDIAETSAVLTVPRAAACLLLLRHGWSISNLQEAWFLDEDGVRAAVGIRAREGKPTGGKGTCGICFDSSPRGTGMSDAGGCGHLFCAGCWAGYIGSAVADGPGCLTLRCPEPSCSVAVDQEMVDRFAGEGDKEKYSQYLRRSYVEGSRRRKWCPAPGCEFALEFVPGGGEGYDVFCRCLSGFCWNCGEEAHRPVDCGTVSEWRARNRLEAANADYVLANCKPCPRCKRAIEKNAGCMHMTCRPPCNFQFCWLCLQEDTNYSHRCNRYREDNAVDSKEGGPEGKKREGKEKFLDRYLHYYARWEANHMSRNKALEELRALQGGPLALLSDKYSLPESQLRCLTEAWLQVAECRRVLMWSFAYGHFLLEEEQLKQDFFEHLQGEAERALERLHHCVEVEGRAFCGGPGEGDSPEEFHAFRNKLSGLTRVTRDYFEKLVRALEGGLEDVRPRRRGAEQGAAGAGDGVAVVGDAPPEMWSGHEGMDHLYERAGE